MIALLSTLLGFLASAAPKVFESFQDKRDKQHELKMLEIQAKMQAEKSSADLDAILLNAVSAQNVATQASYQSDMAANKEVGNRKIVAFSASVRPVITYAFFLLYTLVKFAQFYLIINPALPWQESGNYAQALVAIWGEEDMGLFSAVLAFWFGNRIMQRK
jgi:hypothetical protein